MTGRIGGTARRTETLGQEGKSAAAGTATKGYDLDLVSDFMADPHSPSPNTVTIHYIRNGNILCNFESARNSRWTGRLPSPHARERQRGSEKECNLPPYRLSLCPLEPTQRQRRSISPAHGPTPPSPLSCAAKTRGHPTLTISWIE